MTGHDAGEHGNPMAAAQRLARPELPKRFYEAADYVPEAGGFVIRLDGRPVRTPGRAALSVPSEPLASALAGEWAAQGERIDPSTMPLTRIVNSAIDGVSGKVPEVRAEIAAFAGSDLLCYRAEGPAGLVARQETAWSPILAWAYQALGARFLLAAGIVPVRQPDEALRRVAAALEPAEPLRLAALHVTTTLTGSALLALALAAGRLSAAEAWDAAHVDEDWQWGQWGEDAEARARREARRREFEAAALILRETL